MITKRTDDPKIAEFDWLLIGSSVLLAGSLIGWVYVLLQTYMAAR